MMTIRRYMLGTSTSSPTSWPGCFGPTSQTVREQAAEAALDVVNRHLSHEQQDSGG
jgi:hypothetical protein